MALNDSMDMAINANDFDYVLPEERIARHPLAERDRCRLLVADGASRLETHIFAEIPDLIPADSLLVYNNTRVINARLRFRKGEDRQGALIEIFCLEPVRPVDYALSFASTDPVEWLCFVGNSKRWKEGALSQVLTDGTILTATRTERRDNASVVRFQWDNPRLTFAQIISLAGEIPIPPYLNRSTEDSDKADYQTVYSNTDGSVAAPTAGLHFTPRLLDQIKQKGIECRELTLHVGAGTFQPLTSDDIREHSMHSEFISVPLTLIEELSKTERKIFAVGTTSVRTLESVYQIGRLLSGGKYSDGLPQWAPYDPELPNLSRQQAMNAVARYLKENGADRLVTHTRLMIAPGYVYGIVDGIITNFHQPKSTLLLLVSAFLGGERWKEIYRYALDDPEFRFLSYGDACLFL